MSPRQSGSAIPDRAATLAIIAGAALCIVHLAGAFADASGTGVAGIGWAMLSRLGIALAFLAGGAAVAWVGRRAGAATSRVNDLSRQMSATAADDTAATREVLERLAALELKVRPPRPLSPGAEEAAPPPVPHGTDLPRPTPRAASQASSFEAAAVQSRIVALLEEIREISLLNDEQRQDRLHQLLDIRRRSTLEHAIQSCHAGRWGIADQLLGSLEAQFPNDADVLIARTDFHRQHSAAEAGAFQQTEQRVRDLVYVNDWDAASAAASEFAANFPASSEGRDLVIQVEREHSAFHDAAFQRMYEQVQVNVDRRLWRAALADAKRLLEAFPHHARASRVRQQFKTIADNADIEERQEQEVRIQLLVKGRRFAEAVDLAEEVVRRFPNSPQADALEARLPQLRELAEHGDGNGA